MMESDGYIATVEYDADAESFHGRVLNLRDVITFEGRSVRELKAAFRSSLRDYRRFCADRGEEPERPFTGRLLLRIEPELHRRLTHAAIVQGLSVNGWVAATLERVLHRMPRGRKSAHRR